MEQLLEMRGSSAHRPGEPPLPLEVLEPAVEHLDPIAGSSMLLDREQAFVSLDGSREELAERTEAFELCGLEGGRTAPIDAPLAERRETLLAEYPVSFEGCGNNSAHAVSAGMSSLGVDFVDTREAPAAGEALGPPKLNERRVRWKRFTARRKESSKPLRFEEGST